jgi:hypothetical protein
MECEDIGRLPRARLRQARGPGYPLQSFLRQSRKKGFPLLSLAQPRLRTNYGELP